MSGEDLEQNRSFKNGFEIFTRRKQIVILIVWAVKRFTGGTTSGGQAPGNQSPREILQGRYERGELIREQYRDMLSDLD